MARELIRLDKKHISFDQMTMSVDRVLQCYIRNMFDPLSLLIENYLREAGFWHVVMIGRGCKLDPKLISAFIERWRLETHIFHLPCGKCTITLEDVHLQLELPVDGINGDRIEMGWLRDTFSEPDNDSTKLERIRYARAYILEMIGGYLMLDLSRNLVLLIWLLKLVDFRAVGELSWGSAVLATLYKKMCGAAQPNRAKIGGCLSLLQSWARWNHSASYVGIPTSLKDIRLLLDQRSETEFQWTPYKDPAIRAVIPDEFFQSPNVWHVKVPLVNYTTVDMYQSDRVLRQFGFRQPILVAPEVFDEEHKVYLLEQRGPLNLRRRDDDAGPSTAPTQSSSPTVQRTTPTSQPFQIMPDAYPSPNVYPNPYIFPFSSPMTGWNLWPGSSSFSITLSQPPIYRPPSHEGSHEALSGSSSFYQYPSPYEIQTPPPWVTRIPPQSLFYQGGSPTAKTRSLARGTTTLTGSCSKEESSTDPSMTPMWH
ncbi:hypothetical protein CXB51_027693 [Gossypium anomalum]|uniref:Aminotransferase-like plant mobile domain-containing protein n=1 Tax=Gossypium anomalum TaxID=47600 RepID=A0A8J5YB77_9ROSI|nr:hypothetical protein CXB51_027693 [Gossypium anomalum]